jgi:type I restriction enzyme R subunit
MERSEARTRQDLIDPALRQAGWNVEDARQVGKEIPVDEFDPAAWKSLQRKLKDLGVSYAGDLPSGVTDYALYRPNGEIIAVVEAKRMSTDPRLAEAQAEFYVTELEKRQSLRPFAFLSNGRETFFWDVGRAVKREVAGFFSPEDLERLLYLRQAGTLLSAAPINPAITDRVYQQEAIRRVCEAFERGKRRALLVMATGTGKTRVAISLTDVFLRSNQARRILFVADRDALVRQAKTDNFEKFLPDEPCTRIVTHRIDPTKRLYAVTLQTLSNCFRQFTPGFFDLIIYDEVHRSIFNQWNEVLQYFDGRMVGLTATPAAFIDRNTFLEFDCPDNVPTFVYSYPQAVADGYLVDYSLYVAKTAFQRKGIRGVDLSEEERNALLEQGIDPDELDFSGTDLETRVSNRDTLRKQWEEIWDVCLKDQSGQLPGKTIVFAITQDHALRLADVFEQMYPQFPNVLRVITCKSDFKGTLIDAFKKEDQPRIAVTVDLLETGIDVPEAVNLVFMKPVHSGIKLWQMIGRGTRSHAACKHIDWLPNGHKNEFLILDFWQNDFQKTPDEQPPQDLPVLVALFNTRLSLLERWLDHQQSPDCQRLIAALRAQMEQIPRDSYSVRKVLPEIEVAWENAYWRYLTPAKVEFLRWRVGPLLRYVPDVDVQAATFTHKVERLKLQSVLGQDTAATVQSIAEDVGRLPDFVYEDPCCEPLARLCLSAQELTASTPAQLDQVIAALAMHMKNRRAQPNSFMTLDLPDYIETRGYLLLRGGSQPVYVEEYRRRVEQRILELAAREPALIALQRGEPVNDLQWIALERTLRRELSGSDLEVTEDNLRKAFALKVGSLIEFLPRVLGLEGVPDYGDIVRRQFQDYIASHRFTGDQIRFLRAVQSIFMQRRRRLVHADLYDPPMTAFGDNAVGRWFTERQVVELLAFTAQLAP